MNKLIEKSIVWNNFSLPEKVRWMVRWLSRNTQRNGRPYDEFVFADATGYVLQQGGTCRSRGEVSRMTLPEYAHAKNLTFEVRRSTTDSTIFSQVFRFREYDPCVELVGKLPSGPITVLDAGSNVGFSPLWWCCMFPGAQVAAIELEPGNYRRLVTNVELNGWQDRITTFNRALWPHDGMVTVSTDFRDGREYAFTARDDATGPGAAEVRGITVAQVREQMGWQNITLLKMDIEGGEAGLLEDEAGAAATLEGVSVVAMESHDEVADRSKIEANLERLGYTLVRSHETLFGFCGAGSPPTP